LTNNSNNRVVVTGLGVVSPLGLNIANTWEGLINGKSGIDYITQFDVEHYETKIAGEIKGFEPTAYINRKDSRHMDRFAQLAVAASLQALEKSGIQISSTNKDNIGVVIGSGIGGLTTLFEQNKILLEKGPDRVSPFLIPMMIADIAAAQVSIVLGVKGPNLCTASACSSGSDAIGAACEIIRRNDAQVMIAGGSESIINPIGIASFNALNALSTRNDEPQLASCPFDAERDGFIISEGAGILILESLTHAKKRGANIMAELMGYGASGDAFHITQPLANGDGATQAMQMALNKANIPATEID
jgi:3-oxoacyl-[acyl-carrier-protein] synthase II